MISSQSRKVGLVKTLLASAARTAATGNGSEVRISDADNAVGIVVDVTAAATEVGDKLDVYVQTKLDGSNWVDVYRATQCDGDGGAKRYIVKLVALLNTAEFENATGLSEGNRRNLLGDSWRARWVITDAGADNASFTFSVTIIPE